MSDSDRCSSCPTVLSGGYDLYRPHRVCRSGRFSGVPTTFTIPAQNGMRYPYPPIHSDIFGVYELVYTLDLDLALHK
jgi:hypothetical protein